MEESEIFNNAVDNLIRNLRSFYKVLDNLLFYSKIIKDSVIIDYEYCIGNLIRVDEKFYPENPNSGKLIGFEVFENISKIYFIRYGCCDTNKEELENITIVNLENEAEINYYLENLDTEEIIIVSKLIEEKCRKILLDILLESSKREK